MDVKAIRKANVERVIEKRFNGNQASFAESIKREPAQVWQWLTTTKTRRPIGEKIARHIEDQLELPKLGLDTPNMDPLAKRNAIAEPQPLYKVHPDQQAKILALFELLTSAQRDDFINQIAAAVKSNEAIVREVGGRLSHPHDEHVATSLPMPPDD